MRSPSSQLDRLYSRLPRINCKRKCFDACGPIAMTELEANRIKKEVPSFDGRPMEVKLESGQRVMMNGFVSDCLTCPLLTPDGLCSQYAIRPMVCRIWGLVKEMRCHFGCTPERWVSSRESHRLFSEAERISNRSKGLV